jgi:hypothetical protein
VWNGKVSIIETLSRAFGLVVELHAPLLTSIVAYDVSQ